MYFQYWSIINLPLAVIFILLNIFILLLFLFFQCNKLFQYSCKVSFIVMSKLSFCFIIIFVLACLSVYYLRQVFLHHPL